MGSPREAGPVRPLSPFSKQHTSHSLTPSQICVIDPDCRLIAVHMYDGCLKVIPIQPDGSLREAYNLRLEELKLVSLTFLHGAQHHPMLAIVHQGSTREERSLRTYGVSLKDKELVDAGAWPVTQLDRTALLVRALPPPLCGVLVVTEQHLCYVNGALLLTLPIRSTSVTALCPIDADGFRHLLSDANGVLHLLVLQQAAGAVAGLALQPLGETAAASTLSYLDNGVVFVGSAGGNSQLVRLQEAPDEQGSHVEVLETYPGLGPICDFAVVDLERQGQCQVVTCSGVGRDGSLRCVRNGVGINEQASVELPGVKGIWALRAAEAEPHDSMLVVSFVGETRVLALSADDEMDETEVPGFDCAQQTLLCANSVHNQMLQVTAAGVALVGCGGRGRVGGWSAPAEAAVTCAAVYGAQLLLGLVGGHVVYLEVGEGCVVEKCRRKMEHELSCLDIHSSDSQPGPASLACVGSWDNSALILRLPSLTTELEERLSGDAIPRSVLLVEFEGASHLLVGLGDGHLLTFSLDAAGSALSDAKKLSLGTQPVGLRRFRSKAATHAFASSDRPMVVYSLNKKLAFSNVNLRSVHHMCSFNSASFPDALALTADGKLSIGSIDDIQKLHIRTVPLGEQPRRIAHQESSRTFLVACLKASSAAAAAPAGGAAGGEAALEYSLRLLDDQTFDTLCSYPLAPEEHVQALLSLSFPEDPKTYYIAGTAFVSATESEPSRGRLLVLAVEEGRLRLVAQQEIKGAVYTLTPFSDKLLVSYSNRVALFRWVCGMEEEARELVRECSFACHLLALNVSVRGDSILVGDIMRGASLLSYNAEERSLSERAVDAHSGAWTSAVQCLDDDTFLVAEASRNMLLLRKNGEASSDEERHRLEIAGEFHLGDQVNRIRPGSLVMRLPDSELAAVPTFLYGTVDGVLGVMCCLPAEVQALLLRLQEVLVGTVKGVGGLTWTDWRAFANERRQAAAKGWVDGDLLECYLELPRESQAAVAQQLDMGAPQLTRSVEAVLAHMRA